MGNDFEKGESVICINDHFPYIPKFGGNGDIVEKPKVGEILTIDEVLGDFLMFEKYNTETSTNWFFYNRFLRYDKQCHKEHIEQLEIESKNFGGL